MRSSEICVVAGYIAKLSVSFCAERQNIYFVSLFLLISADNSAVCPFFLPRRNHGRETPQK